MISGRVGGGKTRDESGEESRTRQWKGDSLSEDLASIWTLSRRSGTKRPNYQAAIGTNGSPLDITPWAVSTDFFKEIRPQPGNIILL